MEDYSRLIEHAFPLRQASINSVHEKNVRHGHISTLHIWPARRPLAASRAALLAALLPDPGTPEGRKELCEKIGGRLRSEADKEGRVKEVTDGGVLRWKTETENMALLEWFRAEIRKANGGRAPRVLDPFSGGGTIPLEAMRLGCEVTAADLNPVAWFILKCTLEYPQRRGGERRRLPEFIFGDRDFMEAYLTKEKGLKGAKLQKMLEVLGHRARKGEEHQGEWDFENAAASAGVSLEAGLAWHVRAWGRRVLWMARRELAPLYPVYAEWQPLKSGRAFEAQPMRFVEPGEDGVASVGRLNTELGDAYLQDDYNPRWVLKPAVAYLWARTVTCKGCRATIPLLKTRWLCRKDGKRVLLGMQVAHDRDRVLFSIEHNVPERGGNGAQKRENDKKLGAGTMSRAGAQCPCCPTIMEMEDIQYEGKNGRLGQVMTAVIVEGLSGKEYRLPTKEDLAAAERAADAVKGIFSSVPFGEPKESLVEDAKRNTWCVQYGQDAFFKLFNPRQLACIGRFLSAAREVGVSAGPEVLGYLYCSLSRLVDRNSQICTWQTNAEKIGHTFSRWALPIGWDYCEVMPWADSSGGWLQAVEWVAGCVEHVTQAAVGSPRPSVAIRSAVKPGVGDLDLIVTDPPYYDAIGYAVLMDFFYVWLRRALHGFSPEVDEALGAELSPKWNEGEKDGELVDDAARHGGDRDASRKAYEDGMARAFQACHQALAPHGRLVVVFAHKHPDAWEALVSAIIRAGFVVDGSWPINTERAARTRSFSSAALASSVWLVCRKRDPLAKVGWDNRVMGEMRENIKVQLREFWDAGIRGPDFVWAATGPAMEAYSKYPAVKKANSPTGDFLSVREFLEAVRRIVIEFVVGRVLHIEAGTDRLDPVTSYYLLHRNDFGFGKAPAGACILYAVSCGVLDKDLEPTWNLIKVKGSVVPETEWEEEGAVEDEEAVPEEAGGGEFILRTWKERMEKRMGYEAPGGREVPLIDRVHRLMHLWRDGDVRKVDEYLDDYALRRNELFIRLIQSLIELSERGGEERVMLESLTNHLGAKAAKTDATLPLKLEERS
jgi:adenine-specific DNA methylase